MTVSASRSGPTLKRLATANALYRLLEDSRRR